MIEFFPPQINNLHARDIPTTYNLLDTTYNTTSTYRYRYNTLSMFKQVSYQSSLQEVRNEWIYHVGFVGPLHPIVGIPACAHRSVVLDCPPVPRRNWKVD